MRGAARDSVATVRESILALHMHARDGQKSRKDGILDNASSSSPAALSRCRSAPRSAAVQSARTVQIRTLLRADISVSPASAQCGPALWIGPWIECVRHATVPRHDKSP